MLFFIGWHQPVNGASGCGQFDRTVVSVNRLINRRSLFPVRDWIMDSGAFTRIATGVGHLPIEDYAKTIDRWSSNGNLLAAVTQDFMCEKFILNITGLTVGDHQQMTISNYDKLLPLTKTYIMPVLQGYEPQEYVAHLKDYGDRLSYGAWVGVGSICKRNANASSVEEVLLAIKSVRPDLRLHGFGIKRSALQSAIVWDLLYSADSQAAGLLGGSGRDKYKRTNDPAKALEYAKAIAPPAQLSIFSNNLHKGGSNG